MSEYNQVITQQSRLTNDEMAHSISNGLYNVFLLQRIKSETLKEHLHL